MGTTIDHPGPTEVEILARVLGDGGEFSEELARHILGLHFDDQDKRRMHDLAARNQDDALSPVEREELFAFVKAGDLLAILKAKARRSLANKPKPRTVP